MELPCPHLGGDEKTSGRALSSLDRLWEMVPSCGLVGHPLGLSKSQPGIQWGSERKPAASPGQSKARTLVKFIFHVLTLFPSLGSLSLPPWLNLPFRSLHSYPREDFSPWR